MECRKHIPKVLGGTPFLFIIDFFQAKLHAGTGYVILELSNGCDTYYDDTAIKLQVVGGAAASLKSVYGAPNHLSPGGGGAGHCYGPLNFYFQD